MLKLYLAALFSLVLIISPTLAYQSLQEIYQSAGPSGEYDKYIELDPEVEYLGDLIVSGEESVCLIGHGAIIHGRTYMMSISAALGHLDVSGCVIVGGGYGIYYTTGARGIINNNTIVDCSLQGISTIYQDEDRGVTIYDNIIVGSDYGLFCIENHHPMYIGYNTVWDQAIYRYAEQCLD